MTTAIVEGADRPGAPPDRALEGERTSPLLVGVLVWLTSELMFFGGLFAAWFVLRSHNEPNWPPDGIELDMARMAVFTAVLVSSSLTMELSVRAAERGQRAVAVRWLAFTMLLGAVFIANQAVEYAGLGFGFDAHAFSTIFYLLTGFHGAHVIAGLILMGVVGWVVFSRDSEAPLPESMKATSYYWHFVDVVWVVLFVVVYVLT